MGKITKESMMDSGCFMGKIPDFISPKIKRPKAQKCP